VSTCLAAVIFEYLEANGRQNRKQLVAALGIDPQVTSQTLLDLRRRGKISAVGYTHRRCYSVIKGQQPPEDMRGKAPGCAMGRIRAAKIRQRGRQSLNPVPHLELERCWGWMSRVIEPLSVDETADGTLI
jgi:hypothetical protein